MLQRDASKKENKNMLPEKTQVLIVGGGIAGLTASLLFARYGINSLLIERHAGTSIHPRARGVNARSMEIYRNLGLEEQIRKAGKELQSAVGFLKGATLREALENIVPTEQKQMRAAWQRAEIGPAARSRGAPRISSSHSYCRWHASAEVTSPSRTRPSSLALLPGRTHLHR
jgi:2-polyprenyl-6-methoxyphenol hydroxylase-like FAD-dependent oxidoreductase